MNAIYSVACSPNCTTYGCNTTGANKCDQCDLGFGLTINGSCDGINNMLILKLEYNVVF